MHKRLLGLEKFHSCLGHTPATPAMFDKF